MERRLAAILAVDMVGYSRLMGIDEDSTIARQKHHHEAFINPEIARYKGRVVKTTGDGLLAEFPSVVDAVDCALAFQAGLAEEEMAEPEERRILYRAGINLGDIVIDGDDILGDGVNLAARLESIAPPAGLCVSDMVRQNLRGDLRETFEDIGEQSLKNMARKVRVWRWPASEGQRPGAAAEAARPAEEPRRPVIGVMPFEALSADPDHRFYAQGLAGDIATALSKLDTLRVVSPANAAAAAAGFRIEGSMQVAGPRVRCNVQLVETAGGHHLWSGKFDGQVEEILDFQDRVTGEVVGALEVELSEGQQARTWRREAGDSLAYESFVKGRAAYKEYSRAGIARARAAFEAALERSPAFLSAAVGLARTRVEDATYGWAADRDASLREARRLLDTVFALDPDLASAHAELAHALMTEGNSPAARLEAELAVALDPNYADAHNVLACVLVCRELPEEALRAARRAISLNPGSPEFYLVPMADAFLAMQRHREALAVYEQIIARRPAWIMIRAVRALAMLGLGRDTEAREEIRSLLETSPGFTAGRWRTAIFYRDRPDVPALVERLVSLGLPA